MHQFYLVVRQKYVLVLTLTAMSLGTSKPQRKEKRRSIPQDSHLVTRDLVLFSCTPNITVLPAPEPDAALGTLLHGEALVLGRTE